MEIKKANNLHTDFGDSDHFTGRVLVQRFLKDEEIKCNVARITFEPKARTNWHSHLEGQILIVTDGKGYIQKKDEPIQTLLPGDIVKILKDEVHWHGAAPDSIFTHIAIQPHDGKEYIPWGAAVKDEEYSAQ